MPSYTQRIHRPTVGSRLELVCRASSGLPDMREVVSAVIVMKWDRSPIEIPLSATLDPATQDEVIVTHMFSANCPGYIEMQRLGVYTFYVVATVGGGETRLIAKNPARFRVVNTWETID